MHHCTFALLFLLSFCWRRDKPVLPLTSATKQQTIKRDSISKQQPIPNTYNNYRNLFTKIEPPYIIDLDTISHDYYFYDSDKGITDSLGNPFSARLIPKEMAEMWITDSSNLETKSERMDWAIYFDKFYAPDNFGWFTLQPSIRIESPEFDFMFLLKYVQISFTNGGFTSVYLLTYTKQGKLKKIKDIGYYGYNTSRDFKDKDTYLYTKQTTHTYTTKLAYKSIGKVNMVEKKTKETHLSISRKKELHIHTHMVLYKKHKTIRLL